MSQACETCESALMARLEGCLGEAGAAALEAHLAECAACRATARELTETAAALQALGRELAPRETVDLEAAVMAGARDLAVGRRVLEEDELPEHPLVMDYLDGDLDDLARARFERQLRADPVLRREVDAVRHMDSALRLLAEECRVPVTGVSLEQPVAEAVRAEGDDAPTEELRRLEEALWGLGAQVRAEAPQVDVVDEVMAHADGSEAEMAEQLAALGQALRRQTPRVDLVGDVMGQVHRSQHPRRATRERAAWNARSRAAAWWLRGVGLAAAAVLALLSGWVASQWLYPDGGVAQLAGNSGAAVPGPGSPGQGPGGNAPNAPVVNLPPIPSVTNVTLRPSEPEPEAPESEPAVPSHDVSLASAIKAYREGLVTDGEALLRLAEWARLTPAEARQLIEQGGLSTRQIVSATQYLPAEEAAMVLEALVAEHPDDPYLRLSLARALGESGAPLEDQLAQVAAWGALDQRNGLPSYAEAALQYELGNYDAALRALAQGSSYEDVENYSLDTAMARAQVLEEAGMDPATAEYVSALLGGSAEYKDLSSITARLSELGAYYESVGDYQSATEVYQALLQLGDQVGQSASLPSDTQAAIDTTYLATQALEGLQQLFTDPDTLVMLSQTVNQLADLVGGFTAALGEYNALLSGDPAAVSDFVEDLLLGAWEQMLTDALQ